MINERVFYGRFQGRGLGPYKNHLVDTILPQVRIDVEPGQTYEPQVFFAQGPKKYVCLEIGFGTGDHLAALAEQYPDRYYVGCEVYLNGIASMLEHIEKKSLYGNLRIFPWVIQDFISALEAHSLDDVFIMFPDPWPKLRHTERRLVNVNFLNRLSRVMKMGGHVYIASDHAQYVEFALKNIVQSTDFTLVHKAVIKPEHWPQVTTRYEQKAQSQNHLCSYITLQKK